MKKKQSKNSHLGVFIAAAIVILAIGVIISIVKSSKNEQIVPSIERMQSIGELLPPETKAIIESVELQVDLPEDEIPSVLTISDPSQLTGQAFFENAKLGDKVLIYATARVAILYDANTNEIIDIAPITVGDTIIPETPE